MVCHRRSLLAVLLVFLVARESSAAFQAFYDEPFEDVDDSCSGGPPGTKGLASCGVSLLQTHLNKIRRSRPGSSDDEQESTARAVLGSNLSYADPFVEHRGYIIESKDLVVEMATVEEAKKRCAALDGCKGFTFANASGDGRREVHYKNSSDIESSTWTSFHLDSTSRVASPSGPGDATAFAASGPTLSTLRFEAVDGGSGRSCRGESGRDSRPEYYHVEKAETLKACQQLCGAEAECKGVEYNKQDGRCEVWTNRAGIRASAATTRFFECYRAVRSHSGTGSGQDQVDESSNNGLSTSGSKAFANHSQRHEDIEKPRDADNATEHSPLVEHEQSHLTSFGFNASSLPALVAGRAAISLVKLNVSHTVREQTILDPENKSNVTTAHALIEDASDNVSALKWRARTEPTALVQNADRVAREPQTEEPASESSAVKVHALLEDAWDNDLALKWSERTDPTSLVQSTSRVADEPQAEQLKDLYGTVSHYISSPDKNVLAYMNDMAHVSDSDIPSQKTMEPASLVQNTGRVAREPWTEEPTNNRSAEKAHALLEDAWDNDAAMKWSERSEPADLNISHAVREQRDPDPTNQSSVVKPHSLLQDAWDNDLALKWSERTDPTSLVQSTSRVANEPQAEQLKDLYGTVSRYISLPDKNVLAYMRDMAHTSDSDAPLQKTIEPSSAKVLGESSANKGPLNNTSNDESVRLLELNAAPDVAASPSPSVKANTEELVVTDVVEALKSANQNVLADVVKVLTAANQSANNSGEAAASAEPVEVEQEKFESKVDSAYKIIVSRPTSDVKLAAVKPTPSSTSDGSDSWQLPPIANATASAVLEARTAPETSEMSANNGSMSSGTRLASMNTTAVPVESGAASSSAELLSANATAEAYAAQKQEAILDAEKRLAELSKTLLGAQQ